MLTAIAQPGFTEIDNRFRLYCELLGLSPDDLSAEAELSPGQAHGIYNGVLEDSVVLKIFLALKMNYGVSLDNLTSGRGPMFLFKGPKITEEFYREYWFLFADRENPKGEGVKHGYKNNKS